MTHYATVWPHGTPDLDDGVHVLRRDDLGHRGLLRRLWACRDGDVVLLSGALGFEHRWIDLLCALAIRLRGRRVGVVVSDATWHSRSTRAGARVPVLHPLVQAFCKQLLKVVCGPYTHVCFLSRQEVRDFVEQAGVPEERVHFTPFLPTLLPEEIGRLPTARAAGVQPYVFSGGNSSRDYRLLVEALGATEHRVEVATWAREAWPANFVARPVTHDEFVSLMAQAAVVVVTLDACTRRGVGQQTYLNAMLLGVPVVVNDAVGVRDYIRPDVDGVVVPPRDPAALREAVERLLDPARSATVRQMVDNARATALALGPEAYFARLRHLMRQAEQALVARE